MRSHTHQTLFQKARRLVEALQQAGHEAYLCGGSVRDLLLDVRPKDYDIVTSAEPATVEALFPRTVPVGKQFGVIRVMDGDDCFEVATFREDLEYVDGRRPEGVRFGSVEADARRRDFTINGMFYDPVTGSFVDLVGGREDLEAGVIRAIGDADTRFSEDYLRLLRAVRFTCQLGFRMAPEVQSALSANAHNLSHISAERVTAEVARILCGPDPGGGVRLLCETGILAVILPEIDSLQEQACAFGTTVPANQLGHAELALSHLCYPSVELAVATLCHALEVQALPTVLGRLRLPGRANRRVTQLVADRLELESTSLQDQSRLKRILREDHSDELLELMRVVHLASDGDLGRYHQLRLRLQRWRQEGSLRPAPLLDGQQLISMGYPQGQLFGRILRGVEDAQLTGEVTTDEGARSWVREHFQVALLLLAFGVIAACRTEASTLRPASPPQELTAGQKTLNFAGAPLRLVGAAVVMPIKLLFFDGPRQLWNLTLGDDELDHVLQALAEGNPGERFKAAQRLRRVAAQVSSEARRLRIAAELVRHLDDPQPAITNQLVVALGILGESWVTPRLVRLLKHPDDQIRGSAVIALADLGDLRVGPLLEQLYDSPWAESWFVRSALIQAAGKLSLMGLIPRIRRELHHPDPAGSWLLRVVSIQALGRLEDAQSVPRLRRLLSDSNQYVRTAAAMCLGQLGHPEELAGMLKRALEARQQLPLILAVGRHGGESERDAIVPFLDSPDPTIRAHAAVAMVDLGDPRGVEALISGIQSHDVYERFTCLGRLQKLSGQTEGLHADFWRRWWRDNKDSIRLARSSS